MPGATEEEEEKQSKGTEAGALEYGKMREASRARGFPAFSALPPLSPFLSFPPPSVARAVSGCFQGNGSKRPPREAAHGTLARSHEPRPPLVFGEGRDLERGMGAERDGRRWRRGRMGGDGAGPGGRGTDGAGQSGGAGHCG